MANVIKSEAILSVLIPIFVLVSAHSFEDCPTRLRVLEIALYETGNNLLELNRIFFPPNRETSRFIRVIYSFQNEAGELDDCDVSYIWAIGGFLLMQPPTIFQFTSLFFNYPNNDLKELRLQLPYECRPLISSSCSCFGNETDLMLNIVTQQVSNDPFFLFPVCDPAVYANNRHLKIIAFRSERNLQICWLNFVFSNLNTN